MAVLLAPVVLLLPQVLLGRALLGGPVRCHGSLPHHAAPLPALAHHGDGLALVVLAPALRRVVVG